MTIIDIANEFGRSPGGRFSADGDQSGERFRRELLTPALRGTGYVEVHLDGVNGYPSSFLEEAFGGLVRIEGFTVAELKTRLKLKARSRACRSVVADIWLFIERAG